MLKVVLEENSRHQCTRREANEYELEHEKDHLHGKRCHGVKNLSAQKIRKEVVAVARRVFPSHLLHC